MLRVFPTESEIEQAVELLVDRYDISAQLLGELLGRAQRDRANELLRLVGGGRLSRRDVARLLVMHLGTNLFAGSSPAVRALRLRILSQLPEHQIKRLFSAFKDEDSRITHVSHMYKPLAEKKWFAGGRWPRAFVAAAGFPGIFAGVQERVRRPTVQEIAPLTPVPPLQEFQVDLKRRLLEVMEREKNRTRCVLSLPTGGGKTRVAVEAFIDWMHPRFVNGQYLIWIAQSEELCEQAIATLEQMWGSREYRFPLRVYRYFGGRDVPLEELQGGAVVASINQLYNRIHSGDPALDQMLSHTGVMVIDEAHRAVTHMYDVLLNYAEELVGPDLFPICGLTATPGRSGADPASETQRLVGRFEAYLLTPDLGPEYRADPLRYFREHGYLATPVHRPLRGREYELTPEEIEALDQEEDFPAVFLKRLADDTERNRLIINTLMDIEPDKPTLVYACTVEHAYLLAMILRKMGRTAAAVSGDTPLTLRRGFIQQFKEGKIQFLINYGVLTTGFDAPKTECIVLCRPTRSPVLYEQIIGRGLRGPRFGGTEKCTIIDFADNIKRMGAPLAYVRFEQFWQNPAAPAVAASGLETAD